MIEDESESLRRRARHLRWLASEIMDEPARTELTKLADEYEARAATAEAAGVSAVEQ
ncbi:MAG TPA: hypothetical protein VMB34_29875 [Acetobacteraceae bacterium]|nr:hypothetical protein [Acetobacteraceae bacterium]